MPLYLVSVFDKHGKMYRGRREVNLPPGEVYEHFRSLAEIMVRDFWHIEVVHIYGEFDPNYQPYQKLKLNRLHTEMIYKKN